MTETQHLLPEGFDFTDPALIGERIPHEEFALLRKTEPIWWNAQPFGASGYPDEGYWVVTKHADVRAVSLQDEVFSSHENTSLIRTNTTDNQELHDASRDNIMLFLDGPKHAKLRRIVSRGFTPRVVAGMRDSLDRQAREIVTAAAEHNTGDFVTEVASQLPLATICELIGVPADERQQVFDWSNRLVGGGNGDAEAGADGIQASAELLGYAYQMAEDRKARPRDDIATALVTATIDGEELTALEFGYYVMMLMVAGNETTRNATSQGMLAFSTTPTNGGCSSTNAPPRWPKKWSAGRRRSSPSSAPRYAMSNSAECRSARDSGSACSTARPTTTTRCSTTRSGSTSCEAPTRTWVLGLPERTTASGPTSPACRST